MTACLDHNIGSEEAFREFAPGDHGGCNGISLARIVTQGHQHSMGKQTHSPNVLYNERCTLSSLPTITKRIWVYDLFQKVLQFGINIFPAKTTGKKVKMDLLMPLLTKVVAGGWMHLNITELHS